jgi:hypothetical protein
VIPNGSASQNASVRWRGNSPFAPLPLHHRW